MIRVWARIVGAAAAQRALPAWAGVMIAAAVVFGGTGMHPHDLTSLARAAPGVGAALAALWLVLVAPIGAAMRSPPGASWLRSLPDARAGRALVIGAIAVAAQAPWALLWWLGAGPAAGAIAAGGAAGIMWLVGGVRWPLGARTPRWRGPVRALAGVHARALVRTRGAAIARAIAWAVCGGLAAGLVVRGNDVPALVPVLVAVAIAAPAGLAGVAAPVAESDRAIAWAALGATAAARAAAQALVLGAIGAGLGAIVAIAAALVAAFAPAATLGAAALGAGLGAAGARIGAWGVDEGTRVVIGMTGAAVASGLAIGALGAWAIAGVVAAGAGLAAPLAGRA